jgi:hypothetical protein
MSDRERETLNEIKEILGIGGDPVAVLNQIYEVVKADNPEEKNKFVGSTIHFSLKDVKFEPSLMNLMGMASSENATKEEEEEEEREQEEEEKEEINPRIYQYLSEFYICQEIFEERNAIYKDTFVVLGLWGIVTTLVGDAYRLRNMIREPDHGRNHVEQIEDKLRDVVNQGLIGLMMLHEENFEGKD